MVVILIRWFIKEDYEKKFIEIWTDAMKIPKDEGLYREILTTADTNEQDSKYHSFSLEGPYYKTYINIGIWRSMEDFKRIVENRYFPLKQIIDDKYYIQLYEFEFKLRERIILKVITDRGGNLPEAMLQE
jgi:heme-degrading monooxygenase HmoA